MPTFFNPAANLTANRIPYALGGGRLGDSNGYFDATSGALLVKNGTAGRFSLGDAAPADFAGFLGELTMLGGGGSGRDYGHRLRQTDPGAGLVLRLDTKNGTWASAPALAVHGSTQAIMVGHSADLSNGRIQLGSHTTPGGGYGFFDFSLYRSGAGLAGLNASLAASGQLVSAYGTFAAPGLVPGDSGAGLYARWDGAARWLSIKGHATGGGLTEFRRSDDSGQQLALSDASARFFVPLWLDNAHQAGAPAATGYVTVRDSAGNVMKLLCSNV